MKFAIDPGDVLGQGCWETVKRVLLPVTALWLGCFIALFSMGFSEMVGLILNGMVSEAMDLALDVFKAIFWAPIVLLFTPWSMVIIPVFGVVIYLAMRNERDCTWLWVGCVLIVGLVLMNMTWLVSISGDLAWLAWVMFIFCSIGVVVCAMLLRGWQQNVHARHVVEVAIENEQRRARLESQFGTKSFGQEGEMRNYDE